MPLKPFFAPVILLLSVLTAPLLTNAQMITGTWKGKINNQKVEVKIIQNGDSLTGTSYYYESSTRYRRYSIKGYFDQASNQAVWWDDRLLENNDNRTRAGKMPLLSRADFNCPGDGRMMLDGKSKRVNSQTPAGEVDLDKATGSQFRDDWDYVIDNYTSGANNPDIINEVALNQAPQSGEQSTIVPVKPTQPDRRIITETPPATVPPVAATLPTPLPKVETVLVPPTIEEKFVARKKVLVKEIPVSGDSVLLRFYDNAEIDGDSISLFLNDRLIFQHIRLTGSAYSIALAVKDLQASNELIMVAENLGSIPPNTSFMVAEVAGVRHEARLESTEGSSAMVRFVKKEP